MSAKRRRPRIELSPFEAPPGGTLYDFVLPSGKRLGDATRDEVLEAARSYEAEGKSLQRKGERLMTNARSKA